MRIHLENLSLLMFLRTKFGSKLVTRGKKKKKNRYKEDNFIRRLLFFLRSFLFFVRRTLVLSEEASSHSKISRVFQLLQIDPTVGALESILGVEWVSGHS